MPVPERRLKDDFLTTERIFVPEPKSTLPTFLNVSECTRITLPGMRIIRGRFMRGRLELMNPFLSVFYHLQ